MSITADLLAGIREARHRAAMELAPDHVPGASLISSAATARHMLELSRASGKADRLDMLTVVFAELADAAKTRDDEVARDRMREALMELEAAAKAWRGLLD